MNLLLKRTKYSLYGVFGELLNEKGERICYSLEHSYLEPGGYEAKVPVGTYECLRGIHKLAHGNPFETFEVTDVPGRTGILFHKGNYNGDSQGCVLLGEELGTGCILESEKAFEAFMELQKGESSFTLIIS